jgi:hypothetical protein
MVFGYREFCLFRYGRLRGRQVPALPEQEQADRYNEQQPGKDLVTGTLVSITHFCHLPDDAKRAEHVDREPQQHHNEKDLRPELSTINTGRIRVPGVELRIDIVADIRAPAGGTCLVEYLVLMTASRAGEWGCTGFHDTSRVISVSIPDINLKNI